MNNPLETQVGGTHYKTLGIQPIQFCSINLYDPAAFSALKYITRHASKNGLEDLNKAGHFVELRVQVRRDNPRLLTVNAIDTVSIDSYIRANNVQSDEATILTDLHYWALGRSKLPDTTLAHHILQRIDALKATAYPKNEELK